MTCPSPPHPALSEGGQRAFSTWGSEVFLSHPSPGQTFSLIFNFFIKIYQCEMKLFKNLSYNVLFSPVGRSLSLQAAFIYTLYTGHIICK